ncbi:MAG: sigma-70 family RNA polymerase sigma factor [Clostridia bacterium]|nr:sigma-70 family RNA polymerase sigma factor [Clostridia bacterium]
MDNVQFNALIAKAKNNDGYAIEILSKYCIETIRIHLSITFRNEQEVEDWAHDVFTYKIYSNLPDYFIEKPSAWLNKVADNYVLTKLKKEKRTAPLIEEILDNRNFSDMVNEIMVKDALHKLREIDCQILVLRYYYKISYIQIAKMFKINPATARQRAFRARQVLKRHVTF